MPRFDRQTTPMWWSSSAPAPAAARSPTSSARAGVKTVVLEAGAHHKPDDFIDDEWPSFGQLAWLDERTTSGSWRVATDFPGLPAWTCKTVGGTSVHWAGCCPRFKDWEFRNRSEHGPIDGTSLLDWPIGLADIEPYYDRAEDKLGVTRTNGIPGPPANNNFKVMGNGGKRAGYKDVSTGRMAFNTVPRDGRPATIQDGFNFQGDRQRGALVDADRRAAQGRGRRASSTCGPRATRSGSRTTATARSTPCTTSTPTATSSVQKARAVCVAGNAIETARLLLLSDSPQHPDGLANSSGQVGRNYMRHLTGSVYGEFDKPVRMYRGETMAGIITDEARNDPDRGFIGGYYMQLLALGLPFLRRLPGPRRLGPGLRGAMEAYERVAGHVARRRGHAAGVQPRDPQPRRDRPARPARAQRALRRPPQRRRDARARLPGGRVGLRARSTRRARSTASRRTRRPTTSARAG